MPQSTPNDDLNCDVSIGEYVDAKRRAVEAALMNRQLQVALGKANAANEVLQKSCDYLMNVLQSKLHGKKQHDLGTSYAAAQKFDFYYCIDVAGACSVACPSCPVGNSPTRPPKGFMSVETYTKILEKIAMESKGKTISIQLYNWGEFVLHPKLPEIIRITKGFGFICGMSNNLNTAVDLRGVVRAEPDYMRISVSGATNAVYQRTHKGGDINAVKSNLYLLRHLLDRYKNTRTRVEIGYLVYRHNFQDDLLKMRELCDELSFSMNWGYAILMPVESAIEAAQGNIEPNVRDVHDLLVVPLEKWKELSKPYRSQYPQCSTYEAGIIINFDGSVPLCCGTYSPETIIAKNFLETPYEEIQARKRSHPLCTKCMENMVDFTFTCIRPPEVEQYARSELAKLGTFVGRDGR